MYACFCPVAGGAGAAAAAAVGAGEEKGALAVPAVPVAGSGVGGLGRGMVTCTRYSAAQWKRSRLSVVQHAAAAAPWSWAGLVVRLSGLPGEGGEGAEEEEEVVVVVVGGRGGSGLWRHRMCAVVWSNVRPRCTQGASQK
jgi:hypothetical protein